MFRRFLILTCILTSMHSWLYGQCCSAGNPTSFAFSDQTSLKARSFLLSSSFKYGYSEKYFNGGHPADFAFETPTSFSFMDIRAAFGINNRFTVQAESGYFFAKVQQNPDPYPAYRCSGLGDASVNLRYRFYKSMKHHLELNASLGARIPVGVFDQEKDGVKLPLTLQPSSGSLVYLGGLTLTKSLTGSKWLLYSSAFAEFPQLINSRNFYYRYGNLFNFSVAAAYPVHKLFTPAIQFQFETRGHATREDDQRVDASGYKVISLSPQVESNIAKNLSVHWYADLPVYRYFNSIQLANSFKTGIRFAYKFSF